MKEAEHSGRVESVSCSDFNVVNSLIPHIARVCRSAPQFGVTLLTYEILQRIFYVDFGKGSVYIV